MVSVMRARVFYALALCTVAGTSIAQAGNPVDGVYLVDLNPRARTSISEGLKSCGSVAARRLRKTRLSIVLSDAAVHVNNETWIVQSSDDPEMFAAKHPDSPKSEPLEVLFGREGSTAKALLIFSRLDKNEHPTCMDVRVLVGRYRPFVH